jgi:murein DD-endopeptidase MepM/ murein hydrolase activator NlpD
VKPNRALLRWLVAFMLIVLLVGSYFVYRYRERVAVGMTRTARLLAWFNDPAAHPDWAIRRGERCAGAPFIFPTDGYIGFVWGDSFRPGHNHQGLDIFGGGDVNQTPVIAAYPGYLTRLPDWKSTVIIRLPQDPLQPQRQVWTYYTHMADAQGNSFISAQFPPGASEVYVEAGTLLGYQGNFSGDPNNPVGVHLHFSIVLDDGQGKFRNELEKRNTIDPSPYFGMSLNADTSRGEVPVCPEEAGK